MVGILLVAGVALLLTSVKGQAAPSASESTKPDTVPGTVKKRPGFLGLGGNTREMIPPTGKRTLGTKEVLDTRYDDKGGLVSIKKEGPGQPIPAPTKPARTVRPDPAVAVMPPVRQSVRPPSRFRVPTIPSLKGR